MRQVMNMTIRDLLELLAFAVVVGMGWQGFLDQKKSAETLLEKQVIIIDSLNLTHLEIQDMSDRISNVEKHLQIKDPSFKVLPRTPRTRMINNNKVYK